MAGTPWRGYAQPSNWKKLKRDALERDAHICLTCGATATTVDHITPVARGGGHGMDNLASICARCHDIKTKAEAKHGKALQSRRRPRESHPGVL